MHFKTGDISIKPDFSLILPPCAKINYILKTKLLLKAVKCKVYHISCYAEENEEQFAKEVKDILSSGYDVVHLHISYWKSFMVEELAKEAGVPKIIIHAHSTSVLEKDHREERIAHHMKCVENLNESLATDYWACSWAAAKWLYGEKIPKNRIVIQKNAIDIKKIDISQILRNK